MNRVSVTSGSGERVGHFDFSKAQRWSDGNRGGYGDGSRGTGRGEAVLLTAGGEWVLERWTQWSGEKETYHYLSAERAQAWLLRNDFDEVVEQHFGAMAEEEDRRPGRPGVGNPVHVRLGDLLGRVDEYASSHGIKSRADAVRQLVEAGLEAGS